MWTHPISLDMWQINSRKFGMGQLAELIEGFNSKITDNPGLLPKKIYVIELSDGPTLCLDGNTDHLVEDAPKGKVECTIKTSAAALSSLISDPSKAFQLVMKGKIKFDSMPAVTELAQALTKLL